MHRACTPRVREFTVLAVAALTSFAVVQPRAAHALAAFEESRLSAPDGAVDDWFGYSVAMSEDGSRVVVGATNLGAAYVFAMGTGGWTLEGRLSSAASRSGFGGDVAIDGSGSQVLIGDAVNEVAYLYGRSGTGWTLNATLTAADGVNGDLFGTSVALSHDGIRAAVAAGNDEPRAGGSMDTGSVTVFVRSAGGWAQEARLFANDLTAHDRLGAGSVALSADGSRVIAGAAGRDYGGGVDVGVAYVFARVGTTWTEEQRLVANGGVTRFFGVAVAFDTLASRALIGAFGEGAAYVFVRTGTSWTEEQRLTEPTGSSGERFGASVALSGDGARALVGAPWAGALRPGAVTLFERTGLAWRRSQLLAASDAMENTKYGASVAFAANGTRAVVGGDHASSPTSGGAAYVLSVVPTGGPCATASDCPSGFCVDGVCCNAACGGSDPMDCQACSSAMGAPFDGTCALLPASRVCRPSSGTCDLEETCSGITAECPFDDHRPDGTPCSNGLVCDGEERCAAGACVGVAPTCADGDACTADACAEPGGCVFSPIVGCCNRDADCDDGDVCTVDTCSGPGGTCSASPITGCCTTDADCGGATACTALSCDAANRCEATGIPGCCTVDADCSDGNRCTDDRCDAGTGACRSVEIAGCCASDGDCADGDECTTDVCRPDGTCASDPIAGCCVADAECADGDSCTLDRCSSARCTHEPDPACGVDGGVDGGTDAGSELDAGVVLPDAGDTSDGFGPGDTDAGHPTSRAGGCSCRAAGDPGTEGGTWLFGLLALVPLGRKWRAASRKRRYTRGRGARLAADSALRIDDVRRTR